ncbi:MAG: DUF4124 domain-containing protein [Nitrospirae bacterium]|nr:DUF4124 domain-containing protein [Nitrospirota bacterium]
MAAPAADATYRYADQHGTIHFTDDAGSIPETYRDRTTTIESVPIAAPPSAPVTASSEAPTKKSWTSQWPALASPNVPLPSRYQLGVGLAGLALIAGALVAIRASGSRLVKLGLKLAITAIAVGSFYAMYLSDLNDRISAATRDDAHPTTTGAALVEGGRSVVEKTTETINRTMDATIGQARRAAGTVDQTNQRLEHTVHTIDGEP